MLLYLVHQQVFKNRGKDYKICIHIDNFCFFSFVVLLSDSWTEK